MNLSYNLKFRFFECQLRDARGASLAGPRTNAVNRISARPGRGRRPAHRPQGWAGISMQGGARLSWRAVATEIGRFPELVRRCGAKAHQVGGMA
jgi:hypothetical protein